jgi:gliding motility-associated-like protein
MDIPLFPDRRNRISGIFRRLLLSLLVITGSHSLFGQKQASIWYFGNYAGLDFNSGKAVALTGGQLRTSEGCATISDAGGALLFYTDGVSVWNRQHHLMPNGTGLFGNASSSQSAVIVPSPGNSNLYYIFTTDILSGGHGLCYSLLDIRLDKGNGDITQKNIPLYSPATEKLTAMLHKNGRDIWVISHEANNNNFVAYLVDKDGVNPLPVKSSIGSVQGPGEIDMIGCMTASPDGSMIADAIQSQNATELFDFDNSTGFLYNPVRLPSYGGEYGVTFSADNSKLYVSALTSAFLVQYDLSSKDPNDIIASDYVLKHGLSFGAIQLAADGKIYISRPGLDSLDVINSPNLQGNAAGYEQGAISLLGRKAELGLPNLIQSYYNVPAFTWKYTCLGESTCFQVSDSSQVDSAHWLFGDSAHLQTASGVQSWHTYSAKGEYTVRMLAFHKNVIDTISRELTISPIPVSSLGKDTTICQGDTLLLDGGKAGFYRWSDGSADSVLKVYAAGRYWLEASNGECIIRDTINVSLSTPPQPKWQKDSFVCIGSSFTLSAYRPGCSYLWQDGSSEPYHAVNSAGIYKVKVSNRCGSILDSINIKTVSLPKLNLGRDTLICSGEEITLSAKLINGSNPDNEPLLFHWSNGSTASAISIRHSGTYSVEVYNTCGIVKDSIRVSFGTRPVVNLGPDTTVCENDSVLLTANVPDGTYTWENGSHEKKRYAHEAGTYWLNVSNACGQASDTIHVSTQDCNCYLYMPSAFTPDGNALNDDIKPSGCPAVDYHFTVYNRWGELVFETDRLEQGWDGRYHAENAPDGLYFYQMDARGIDHKAYHRRGTFYLIRP